MSSNTPALRTALLAIPLIAALQACGGGGSPSAPPAAPPEPPPLGGPGAALERARSAIAADTCFAQAQTSGCNWTEHAYAPREFAMERNTGEAIMIVDEFATLPLRAYRFRNRIKGFYRVTASGLGDATGSWRLPAVLAQVLDQYSGPAHVAAQTLAPLSSAIAARYPVLDLDSTGHGSYVFSLLADSNPHQPLVLVHGINLAEAAPADYCDATGSPAVQARLLAASQAVADKLRAVMAEHNVRFINYSQGHSVSVLVENWPKVCKTAVPAEPVLRAKLAAYGPMYKVLFGTPGVITAHAAADGNSALDFPYDQASPDWPNRLRVGFFTSLKSGLDAEGRGDVGSLTAWPAGGRADIYVNTGVMPTRPFAYGETPLLQLDTYGVGLFPISAPTTSWVTPLALTRLINVRYSQFDGQAMSDTLVQQVLAGAVPARCADQPGGRCHFQDPLLHGQVEAVRLGYRPLRYTP
jgi:hypothetical protein